MPISTYGTLYPPFVSLQQSQSIQGFSSVPQGFNFGVVDSVNYANVITNVGASCLFEQKDAILVNVGNGDYYIVDEKKLIFREFILP